MPFENPEQYLEPPPVGKRMQYEELKQAVLQWLPNDGIDIAGKEEQLKGTGLRNNADGKKKVRQELLEIMKRCNHAYRANQVAQGGKKWHLKL